MKKSILPAFMGLMLFLACSNDDTSECIDDEIESFQATAEWCTGASIIQYEFNDREVYAFSQGQCISDGGTTVYDSDCTEICFLGGIVGFTECEGIRFDSAATQITVIATAE